MHTGNNIKILREKKGYSIEKLADLTGTDSDYLESLEEKDVEASVSELLKISEVLKSPAYRKTENLLLDGLILESGKILKNNKRVSQYFCIFDEVHAIIKNNELVVEGIICSSIFNQSSITKTGLFSN